MCCFKVERAEECAPRERLVPVRPIYITNTTRATQKACDCFIVYECNIMIPAIMPSYFSKSLALNRIICASMITCSLGSLVPSYPVAHTVMPFYLAQLHLKSRLMHLMVCRCVLLMAGQLFLGLYGNVCEVGTLSTLRSLWPRTRLDDVFVTQC